MTAKLNTTILEKIIANEKNRNYSTEWINKQDRLIDEYLVLVPIKEIPEPTTGQSNATKSADTNSN